MDSNKLNEIWKDIKGYEGLYQVSNLGRVKALERKFTYNINTKILKEKIKKQCETSKRNGKQGYLCTRLKDKNGNSKCLYTHRLVAEAFIPNPDNKETVNHIDGNKHNNNVNNLEWNTFSENNKHAITLKLRPKYCGFLKNYHKVKTEGERKGGFGSTNR